jgi:fructokinase
LLSFKQNEDAKNSKTIKPTRMKKITAIGEILFDVYPDKKNLGGAPMNFLYHVHKITGQGNIISRVGSDMLGKKVLRFLGNNNIPTKFIQEDHLHPTGIATVLFDDNKQPSFIINTESAYDYIELTSELEQLVKKETDCFYFGTLAQRSEVTRKTIQSLLNKGAKYFYDLNIRDNFFNKEVIELSLKATHVLKVNLEELKLLNDLFLPASFGKESFEINKISGEIMERFVIEILAVTLGGDGSVLFRNGKIDYYKPDSADVVDSVGAGDAFASILCIGYLQAWSLKKINRLANNFASEICKIKGALPENDDVYDFIKVKVEYD